MNEFGIGVLGFGTVGAGVVQGLQDNGDLIASRLGVQPVVRAIADLDLTTDRGVHVNPDLLTTDAEAVIDNPDINVIVELIGGTNIARDFITRALEAGKPVVTANKALLAKHGEELFALAESKSTEIYFGASVGGGIPIIRALREGLIANHVHSIHGILNGTCNYILTRMEEDGMAFDTVLAEAQEKGFAEADPALDIDGMDTAHKAVILGRLAYGLHASLDDITIEGIRGLSEADIKLARGLGYRIKLLAIVKKVGSEIDVRVHPAMVPLDHVIASIRGVFNAVLVDGDMTGDTLYYGKGAGREPTASTVIGDIGDIMKNLQAGSARRFPPSGNGVGTVSLMSPGDVRTRYYLRLSLLDQPGTLSQVAATLGEHGISIASVLQQESHAGDYVPVVVVTHEAVESDCDAAIQSIMQLDVVHDRPVRIRIEE
jgi:homoserine dehydrogenase